jgi:hypothetical protein
MRIVVGLLLLVLLLVRVGVGLGRRVAHGHLRTVPAASWDVDWSSVGHLGRVGGLGRGNGPGSVGGCAIVICGSGGGGCCSAGLVRGGTSPSTLGTGCCSLRFVPVTLIVLGADVDGESAGDIGVGGSSHWNRTRRTTHGSTDGHLGRQLAMGSVQACLNKIFSLWLSNQRLKFGGGKRVHQASFRDNEQQDLSSRQGRQLISLKEYKNRDCNGRAPTYLLHNTSLSFRESNVTSGFVDNKLDLNLSPSGLFVFRTVFLVVVVSGAVSSIVVLDEGIFTDRDDVGSRINTLTLV